MYCTRDFNDELIFEEEWFDCADYIECEECPYWSEGEEEDD